jgi:hypothetical protein
MTEDEARRTYPVEYGRPSGPDATGCHVMAGHTNDATLNIEMHEDRTSDRMSSCRRRLLHRSKPTHLRRVRCAKKHV